MTTTGRTTECSANRRRAFGSLSSTDVSTTYTRVRTVASVELQGAVAISVTVILSAGRTLASARLDHGPKAVGLLNSRKSARERIRMPPSGRLPLRPCWHGTSPNQAIRVRHADVTGSSSVGVAVAP